MSDLLSYVRFFSNVSDSLIFTRRVAVSGILYPRNVAIGHGCQRFEHACGAFQEFCMCSEETRRIERKGFLSEFAGKIILYPLGENFLMRVRTERDLV